MPYIKQEIREELNDYLYTIGVDLETVGELNYCFTVLMKHYLKKNGTSYKTLNDCIGVLEAAKLEFYRRTVVPYENLKIDINGDIQV